MQLVRFKRTRKTNDEPIVSISGNKFHFSALFSKLAELDKYFYVSYQIDDNERMIAFDFTVERTNEDAFALVKGDGRTIKSPAGELISARDWVQKVSKLINLEDRKFTARRLIGKWMIQLCPAFESIVPREKIDTIPTDSKGIYRYINKGEVVYIGQGDIKVRSKEPHRSSWVYDTVEYSILYSKESQLEWESYWIEKHKNGHNGLLPVYNNQSGVKLNTD